MQIDLIKKHLSDIRSYIIFSIIFFLISIVIGYFFARSNPDETAKIIDDFRKMIEGAGEPSTISLFIFILLRNTFASLLAMLLGVVFGIFPLLGLFTNGMMLGIFAFLFSEKITSVIVFLAGILPHGIFELAAFFFSAATGLWLGMAFIKWLLFDKEWINDKFIQSVKFFAIVILPLLVLAAFIETFITPKILSYLIGN